jgi:ABC-2 type transport system ATP-binding protein
VDSDQLDPLLRRLVPAGVRTLVSQPPTLEELFLRHYADDGNLTANGHDQQQVHQ